MPLFIHINDWFPAVGHINNMEMVIHKGYQYRIYPTKQQAELINKMFGCCRFVYNHFLAFRKTIYASEKRNVSSYECMKIVTSMKQEFPWLSECDSMAVQESIKDLNRAFVNFFQKRAGYPKFHKKHYAQSYHTRNQNNGIQLFSGKVKLPKVGILKTKVSRFPSGRILNATVSRSSTGKFYISLCVEEELIPKENLGCITGVDVGLKEFYTDSNGNCMDSPKAFRHYQEKLARQQRKLSRMMQANIFGYHGNHPVYRKPLSECRNYQKQRLAVARTHEKIANIRNDFLHKLSTELVRENAFIGIEHLNIRGMKKNHRLAKSISDAGWGTFFSMLEYKAFEHGCTLVKIPTFYPSSQTCSACGYQNKDVKSLSIRKWTCPECQTTHDRDINAANNILRKALELYSTAGHAEI